MKKKKILFYKISFIFILLLLVNCSKTFSGVLLEKKKLQTTQILPDGKTIKKTSLGKKVDIQSFIIIKNDTKLIVRGEYKWGWTDIQFSSIIIAAERKNIELKCLTITSKNYIFYYLQNCNTEPLNEDHLIKLKKIIQSNNVEVTFKGFLLSFKFNMSDEQKKAFNLILNKFEEIK